MNVKDIFNSITISYDGLELNYIGVLKDYGEYLCDLLDSPDRHSAALMLHTGSIYYQAIAITIAAIHCLFYDNTDIDELIQKLKPGDMLIMDGERVRFNGVIDGSVLGVGFSKSTKYLDIQLSNGNRRISLEKAKNMHFSVYQGDADTLGGKGVKNNLKERVDFLSTFIRPTGKIGVSSLINNSVAIITDKVIAEDIYRNVVITYKDKRKVHLSDLVTATYFTDNESYQFGKNPIKEEPIIRFYSKISACIDDIVDDKNKRIICCVIEDAELWVNNSEIHSIADRKSLRTVILSGKTDYELYNDWFKDDKYKLYAIVPEILTGNVTDDGKFKFASVAYKKELSAFASRKVKTADVASVCDTSVLTSVKFKLLKIMHDVADSQEKSDFLISAFFLLNLCRSAFFPLSYCQKAYDKNIIRWTLEEKLSSLKLFSEIAYGESKESAEFVYNTLANMVEKLRDSNPKGEYIKERMYGKQIKYIVATKAYYAKMFALWMEDCKIIDYPQVITLSQLKNGAQILDRVVFPTVYYSEEVNPYAGFDYSLATILIYPFEKLKASFFERLAYNGNRLICSRNYLKYKVDDMVDIKLPDESENAEDSTILTDETFESEMDKFARELLIGDAKRYASQNSTDGDNGLHIEKIIVFNSGCVGYFTKYYKAYRIEGDDINEVDLSDLKVGDRIVFTKQSDNKDIVDVLLNQLLEKQYKQTKYPLYYCLSNLWKLQLNVYRLENNLTYQELAEVLSKYNCNKQWGTIRSWLDEDSRIVGPRDAEDYVAIVRLTSPDYSSEDLEEACKNIRSLRRRILGLLGKAIIKHISANVSDTDDLWQLIKDKADNLAQIEQIAGMSDAENDDYVSGNMINKPIAI